MASNDVTVSGSTNAAADVFAALGGSKTSGKTATNSVQDAQDRFLTLLLSQIKNQDPLNPLDNSQVTTQLAQLNTANGIQQLNTTLSQLLAGYNETQGLQAAGIIGKSVLVSGNSFQLTDGKPVVGGASLAGAADTVKLTVKDAFGKVVQTQDLGALPAGISYFSWDGKDADGKAMADGKYTYSLTATASGQKVDVTPMAVGTVSAVTRTASGFILDLGATGDVAFKDVQQIL